MGSVPSQAPEEARGCGMTRARRGRKKRDDDVIHVNSFTWAKPERYMAAYRATWRRIVLHGGASCYMAAHCATWRRIVLHGGASCYMAAHRATWRSMFDAKAPDRTSIGCCGMLELNFSVRKMFAGIRRTRGLSNPCTVTSWFLGGRPDTR